MLVLADDARAECKKSKAKVPHGWWDAECEPLGFGGHERKK